MAQAVLGCEGTIYRMCRADNDCDDHNECTSNHCNPDGVCVYDPVSDGAPCAQDDVFCNGIESCRAGICTSPGSPCEPGEFCNEERKICGGCGDGQVRTEEGEECDPGEPKNDHCCDPESCRWVAADTADPQGLCSGAGQCRIDVCDGAGACTTLNREDGTPCGEPGESDCDLADSCLGGECSSNHRPASFLCRPATGECDVDEYCPGDGPDCPPDRYKTDDTPCTDDGVFCNGPEKCHEGVCASQGSPCPVGVFCNEERKICGGCGDGEVNTAEGEQCDPGPPKNDHCCDPLSCHWTPSDQPDPQLVCTGAPACQVDLCNGSGDCRRENLPDGSACGDGSESACDRPDTCRGGVCGSNYLPASTVCRPATSPCDVEESCPGDGPNCPPDNYRPNGAACSGDGLFCTGQEVCVNGQCVSPGDPCRDVLTCNESNDRCGDCSKIAAPLPLLPRNGTLTGSLHAPAAKNTLRPLLRWLWAEDGCGAVTFELQIDDSCSTAGFLACAFASPEVNQTRLLAKEFRPTSALPVSNTPPVGRRYYWRVRACRGTLCSVWSPVRYVDVGRVAGDFNGDGYSDLVVSASEQDKGAADEGNVFIYYGSASGVAATPSLTLDNPANQEGGAFGFSVALAGDTNGDGFADLAVAAPLQDGEAADEGKVFIYHGSAEGFGAAPFLTLDNPDGQEGGYFGRGLAAGGDLNGDGFSDVVVGAPLQDVTAADEGKVFVYYGSAAGLPSAPSSVLAHPAPEEGAYFGIALALLADADGNGCDELATGASKQDGVASDQGSVYIYYGAGTGPTAPPGLTLSNPASQSDGHFGFALASAGDVNGDGYGDLLVGAHDQDSGAEDEGNVFVYYGSSVGLPAQPSDTLDNPENLAFSRFGIALDTTGDSDGDGFSDFVAGTYYQGKVFLYRGGASGVDAGSPKMLDNPSAQVDNRFGNAVCGAGDLNGDGFSDLAVGAVFQNTGARDEGNVYVYYGSASGIPSTPGASLDNPANQANGHFGISLAWLGITRGDGQ